MLEGREGTTSILLPSSLERHWSLELGMLDLSMLLQVGGGGGGKAAEITGVAHTQVLRVLGGVFAL